MAWPPQLNDLKEDLGDEYAEVFADDARLTQNLDAAVTFVERIHDGRYNFDADPLVELPVPDADLELGTIRLAGRWFTRRRSPDGLVAMAEMGAGRVPSFDADIERLLRIGRHGRFVFG